MSGHRRIRHARLACANDADAWRGRTLMEDALRTASLGDEGRLLLMRRLDLGRLAPGASATEWRRRCEERFRNARFEAVPPESPAAGCAAVVMFRDATALWVALAVRVARGMPCREWFWRAGASDWQPTMTRPETLRLCFAKLADHGGLAATAELAGGSVAVGAVLELLAALPPAAVTRLFPALGVPVAGEAPNRGNGAQPAAGLETRLPQSWRVPLVQAVRELGSADPRVRWLAAAAVFTGHGTIGPARAMELADELLEVIPQTATQPEAAASRAPEPAVCAAKPNGPPTTADVSAMPAEDEPSQPALQSTRMPMRPMPDEAAGIPTQFGGLFFLVPLFGRLGAAEMPPGAAWLALRFVLGHVARGVDDPLPELLAEVVPEDESACWPAAAALALGAHRRCRKLTGLGLRAVLRRPARVLLTRTHVEVFLRLADVDVRIRRAALDTDPGWVPWLGRAIAFHYTLDENQ
jgi:hypothetical protein